MFAAVTDHVFIDGGHTIDFTNKAFEVLDHLGWDAAADVLPTLVAQTAAASRSEERGAWRFPHDLAGLIRAATAALPERLAAARDDGFDHDGGVARLAWSILAEDPAEVVAAIDDAIAAGATPEELGRAVAYAAALRITRFHTQNDHGDWDEVHHAFTAANALHQAIRRGADARAAARRLPRRAARLPRPLPQRPRRPPARRARRAARPSDLADLQACWDQEGRVDEAGAIVYRYLARGGDPGRGHRRPRPRAARPRTPSSTGSRPTRPPSASSTPGRPGPRRAR